MAPSLMLAIVWDKPGWRAARPAGTLAQQPCCVLHPGESGDNMIAEVTLISVGWRYCIWKRKSYLKIPTLTKVA